MSKHVEAAGAYTRAVLSGEIPACKWVKLAVQRQVDDLQREASEDWPWVFDHELASRPCEFIELLPHIKGQWAKPLYIDGKFSYAKIQLEDWQIFAEIQLFGWKHRDTGLRRFRRRQWERRSRGG